MRRRRKRKAAEALKSLGGSEGGRMSEVLPACRVRFVESAADMAEAKAACSGS